MSVERITMLSLQFRPPTDPCATRIDSIEQGVCPANSNLTATIHPGAPSWDWQACRLERLTSPAPYWAASNGREELPEYNVVTRHHDRTGERDARVRGHAADSAGAGSQDGGAAQDPVRQIERTAAASFAPACAAMGRSVQLRWAGLRSGPRHALIELLVAQRDRSGRASAYRGCNVIGDASATVANREPAASRNSRVDRR